MQFLASYLASGYPHDGIGAWEEWDEFILSVSTLE